MSKSKQRRYVASKYRVSIFIRKCKPFLTSASTPAAVTKLNSDKQEVLILDAETDVDFYIHQFVPGCIAPSENRDMSQPDYL